MKYSVFLRLKMSKNKIIKKISPELITFLLSAFWHGFYPGYYFCFIFGFFVERQSLLLEKKKIFYYIEGFKKNIYTYPLFVISSWSLLIFLNTCGIVFTHTLFYKAKLFLFNINFSTIIIFIILELVLLIIPNEKNKEKENEKIKSH